MKSNKGLNELRLASDLVTFLKEAGEPDTSQSIIQGPVLRYVLSRQDSTRTPEASICLDLWFHHREELHLIRFSERIAEDFDGRL